jgi:hypothetical protein
MDPETVELIRAVIIWRHSVLDSDVDIDRLIEACDKWEATHDLTQK